MNSGSVPTIKNYLDILGKSMTVLPIQKYSPSTVREKQSVPKMQVFNSSFRNRYSAYSFGQARVDAAEWGRQVESAVGAYLADRITSAFIVGPQALPLEDFFSIDIKTLF